MAREELARFLRDRREALRPGDAGARGGGGARQDCAVRKSPSGRTCPSSTTPGLSRRAARGRHRGYSTAWPTRSSLRQAERAHLFRLAGVPPAAPDQVSRQVRPHVAALLDRMPDSAAIVTAATYDVIAWNPLAHALFGDAMGGDRPNLARRRFLNRDESSTTGHEDFGQIAVGAAAGGGPPATPSIPGSRTCCATYAKAAWNSPNSGPRTRYASPATGPRP